MVICIVQNGKTAVVAWQHGLGRSAFSTSLNSSSNKSTSYDCPSYQFFPSALYTCRISALTPFICINVFSTAGKFSKRRKFGLVEWERSIGIWRFLLFSFWFFCCSVTKLVFAEIQFCNESFNLWSIPVPDWVRVRILRFPGRKLARYTTSAV